MKTELKKLHLAAIAIFGFLGVAAFAGELPAEMPKLFPQEEEIQAALEAAPPHLREEAGVYVLKETGYESVRESRNGFTCLVDHGLAASFEPECFDAEGTETILPVVVYRAKLRAKGASLAEINRAVGEGYSSGRFRAPRRVGICYMLSPKNVVILDRQTGKVGHVPPHLMFYAPYLKNADFGATPDFASHFIIADEGSPTAFIILMAGSDQDGHKH